MLWGVGLGGVGDQTLLSLAIACQNRDVPELGGSAGGWSRYSVTVSLRTAGVWGQLASGGWPRYAEETWVEPYRTRGRRRGRRLATESLEVRLAFSATAVPRIYYDYLEGDTLSGGSIVADPTNPLHARIDVAESGGSGTVSGAAGLTSSGAQVGASSSSTPIVNNGPSANRIDIVFVGDGYTEEEMPSYASDVARIVPQFFNKEPLKEYASYFNVHRVDVISAESGVDHDPTTGILKNTALDMQYNCSGIARLLCVNVTKAYNQALSAPEVDQILAIANSSTYGGAGYAASDLAVFAGKNNSSIEIGIHEFGHSFAELADEYDYGGPTVYEGGEPIEPNVSKLNSTAMDAQQSKWYRWLDTTAVDTFEGAKYSRQGIYRPTENSIMRSLGRPFEAVNAEQLIYNMYREVTPIDGATPAGSYPSDQQFFVKPLRPATHALQVSWLVDGTVVAQGDIEKFSPASLNLAPGLHQLQARVVDTTDLVRDESIRDRYMTAERSWTFQVTVPVGQVVDRWAVYAGVSHPTSAGGVLALVAPHEANSGGDCDDADLCGKVALLPGQSANGHNYLTNVQGITGIAVDVSGVAGPLTASDFSFRVGNSSDTTTWTSAPSPLSVEWFDQAGTGGSGRAVITWSSGSIENEWLEVTVEANIQTRLTVPDVHYWGHQTGQTVTDGASDRVVVDSLDQLSVASHPRSFLQRASLNNPYDLNRDGLVDGTDLAIARDSTTAAGAGLLLWAPPTAAPALTQSPAPAPSLLAAGTVGARVKSPHVLALTETRSIGPASSAIDSSLRASIARRFHLLSAMLRRQRRADGHVLPSAQVAHSSKSSFGGMVR